MRLATLIGLTGVVIGFVLGYSFWSLQVDELTSMLERTRADLQKTQGWLGEEMRSSDERHEQVSAKLNKALADLARARAQLARLSTAARRGPGTDAGPLPPSGASAKEVARSAF